MVSGIFHRWTIGLCILVSFCSCSFAVAEEEAPGYQDLVASIRQQLKSENPREVAWAAYYAGEHRIKECVPDLLKLTLSRTEIKPTSTGDALSRAVDAALIEIFPLLSVSEMQRLLDCRKTVLVTVLASKQPDRFEKILLSIYGRGVEHNRYPTWIAACNLLATIRSKKLVGKLLEEIQVKLILEVCSDSSFHRLSRAGGGACHDGIFINPTGFPPIVYHSLSLEQMNGGRIVASGPSTVYLCTEKGMAGKNMGFGYNRYYFDNKRYQLSVLLQLAGETINETGLSISTRKNIIWSDLDTLRREAFGKLNDIQTRWKAVTDTLLVRGLVSNQAISILPPNLALIIIDRRRKTEPTLPEGKEILKKWFEVSKKASKTEPDLF